MRRVQSGLHSSLLFAALVTAGALVLPSTFPSTAQADKRPRLASDAFYVGMRVDPGVALQAAWDLDIYLDHERSVSLGPGVSVAVLGTEQSRGRDQDFLLCADVLRFKVGVNEPGGAWHPYFMLGVGFLYARMPEQTWMLDEMTSRSFPELEEFAGLMSFGAGADLFSEGPWGLALLWTTRFRLSGTSRLPDEWMELAIGIRFGI
jgi:hypothetical protein